MFQKPIRLAVEAGEFFDHVGAYVAVFLFDSFGCFETAVCFAPITEERLDKVGDITTGDGDAFDGAANYVAFCDWDNVGDAVAGVDDDACEGPVGDFGRGPGCCQCEDGLDSDVEACAVEGFEHDFCRVFSVFGRVQGLTWGVSWIAGKAVKVDITGSVRRK